MSQFGTYPDYRDNGVSLERAKQLEEQNGPYPIPVQIGPQGPQPQPSTQEEQ
jgi:hypothetical protein